MSERMLRRSSGPAGPGRHVDRDRLYPVYCFALLAIVSVMCALAPRLIHWFLIPVLGCGLLIGRDAMRWVSGQLDPFDPKGVIAVLGLHFFVFAPLLVVYWDFQYDVATRPADWRPWVGIMAALNAAGLSLYLVLGNVVFHSRGPRHGQRHRPARRRRWRIDENRALYVLMPALLISGFAQAYLWLRYGGIASQIESYKGAADMGGRFKYQLLAGSFPILLLITLSVLRARRDRNRGRYSVAIGLIILTFVLYFIADGLRGSRSTTVWTLFWAAGIVHYFWRRMSARLLLAGVVPIFMFMYLYGFYKAYGHKLLETYEDSASLAELSARSGRTIERLVISDLSRADIQSFLVYRLLSENNNYSLQWGATYAETVPRVLIPSSLWPSRPVVPKKALAGARLHYGGPAPYSDRFSKVYGLAGEGMLNFHMAGVLFGFALFGLAMGRYRRYLLTWPEYDARLYIAPFMANWFITALSGDFDNVVTFTLTKGAFPLVVLLLIVKYEDIGTGAGTR